MVMIKNRKTVKGKLGSTRPKDTDFAGIARKQSRKKKTTTKSNRPTDARTKALRTALKEKQKLAGKGLGQAGQAFLGGSAKQTPVSPKKKATAKKPKPVAKPKPTKLRRGFGFTSRTGPINLKPRFAGGGKTSKTRMAGGGKTSKYRMAGGGKTSKYRMAGGGKTSKYRMAGGGKTSKYRMKGGGKTSKYMAKGGKTSKYMARGGRAK
tara:strand:+ start:236 stop:859 length:624 start_codon:yes stop_codon:yes gene_type:complete